MILPPRLLLTVLVLGTLLPGHATAVDDATGDGPTLSPAQARDDVQLAIDVAEAALPDLHWHQPPGGWEAARTRALQDAAVSDDAMDVYVAVARLMAHVREGHLDVAPSEAARDWQRAHARLLPLDLHWSREGVFVSGTHGDARAVPVGSRVESINGEPADALLDELASLSARDGDILTGTMRECPGRCYAVLRHRIRGDETGFALRYRTPDGRSGQARLSPHPMRERPPAPGRARRIATLEWVAPGIAYLEVSTFSNRIYREAGTSFQAVIQRLFEEIHQGGADRLILDLRENGGGSEPNEAILYSHLVAEPLQRYRSVEARGRMLSVTSPAGTTLTHEVFDAEEMAFQQPLADGRLGRRNLPPEGLMSHWERAAPVYTGRLAILIGGRTFSGGAELAAMLRHVGRGVFVGEETGGTYEGNTSGYSWDVTLPHSGVTLGMPLLRFRFDWDAAIAGRGVLPDCDVAPRVSENGLSRDRAWHAALALVQHEADPRGACPADAAAVDPPHQRPPGRSRH